MRVVCVVLLMVGCVVGQEARTPRLGVVISDEGGVRVDEVREGSAAARAGVKVGDRIVKVGDVKVANGGDLMKALSALRVGSKATIVVERDGKPVPLQATFADAAPAGVRRPIRVRRGPDGELVEEGGRPVAPSPEDEARDALERARKLLNPHRGVAGVKKVLEDIAAAEKALDALPSPRNITRRVRELLDAGATPDEIREKIAEEFPGTAIKVRGGDAGPWEEKPRSDKKDKPKGGGKGSR